MHILDKHEPCAYCYPHSGRTTTRAYGDHDIPTCRVCRNLMVRAGTRAALASGRTWGMRWEIVISALKAMAYRSEARLARALRVHS